MKQMTPEQVIAALRNTAPDIQIRLFRYGGCWEFYVFIRQFFPQAVPYHDPSGHIIVEIDGKGYDILGVQPIKDYFEKVDAARYRRFKPSPHVWQKRINNPFFLQKTTIAMEFANESL